MTAPQCLTLRVPAGSLSAADRAALHAVKPEPVCVQRMPQPADIARLRAALERIASTSPRAWSRPGCAEDERCLHCRALIDEARDALGWARWPAPTGTPA